MKPCFFLIGALACASAGLGAQAPTPQAGPATPSPGAGARRFIAIGCISRDKPSSTPEGRGAAASSPRYILTDLRGDSPKVYVLEGDESTLALHVGHTVEATGPLTVAPPSAGPGANALIMKVTAVTYLSRTCVSLK
jgi:hypothetical protein